MPWLESSVVVVLVGLACLAYGRWQRRTLEVRHPPSGAFVMAGDVRLHALVRGVGRPVVFLHGHDGTVADFGERLVERAAADFRVHLLDRPGHGYSGRPAGPMTVDVQRALVRTALRELGVERPVLVAHSWAGLLALAYALEHPDELAGLVLLNPACYMDGGSEITDPRLHRLSLGALRPLVAPVTERRAVRRWLRQAFHPEPVPTRVAHGPITSFRTWRPDQHLAARIEYADARRSTPALSRRYGSIDVPVVIVTGDGDRITPPSRHGWRLHNQVVHSRLIVLDGAGHMIHLTRPDAVMHAIHLAWELAHERTADAMPWRARHPSIA